MLHRETGKKQYPPKPIAKKNQCRKIQPMCGAVVYATPSSLSLCRGGYAISVLYHPVDKHIMKTCLQVGAMCGGEGSCLSADYH